jgi:uncharacterized DUF497 family protein
MNNLIFDWDERNVGHLVRHQISPEEAEQVVLNRPVELGSELRNGEEWVAQIGETDAGRVLTVISTMAGEKIRVVTAWPANKKYQRYFLLMKRNGDVGRAQDQDIRE